MQEVDRVLRIVLKAAMMGGLINSVLLVRLFMNDTVFPSSNEKALLLISSTLVVILSIMYLILYLVSYKS